MYTHIYIYMSQNVWYHGTGRYHTMEGQTTLSRMTRHKHRWSNNVHKDI